MVKLKQEHDSDGVAAWRWGWGDLPEETMLELRTEACVGVEWFQTKGTACTTVPGEEGGEHTAGAKSKLGKAGRRRRRRHSHHVPWRWEEL